MDLRSKDLLVPEYLPGLSVLLKEILDGDSSLC